MQETIHIRDELVPKAHPDGPYIVLRREGEPGSVRIYLDEVRYLADTMLDLAAQTAGHVVGYDD